MRITIVNKHRKDDLGGSELQCDFIANELTERGYNVSYVAVGGKQDFYSDKYRVFKCKNSSSEIIKKALESKPDLLYWRYNKNHFYDSVKEINRHGIKIIFAASHINDLKPWVLRKGKRLKVKIRKFIQNRLEHRGFEYVDAVTVNNKAFLEKVPFEKKCYVSNGMITKSTNFKWKKPFCVWVANLKASKRPELFVKLAESLENSGMDFLMIGHIQQNSYQWLKNDEQTPSNFHYLGPKTLEEVNGILHESKFHVHTCIPEGFPNIFIQAWLQGKPSISLGFDPSGYISEHKLGYSADENWDEFVRQIKSLIDDKEKREVIGNNAKEFASGTFTIKKSVDTLEDFMVKEVLRN